MRPKHFDVTVVIQSAEFKSIRCTDCVIETEHVGESRIILFITVVNIIIYGMVCAMTRNAKYGIVTNGVVVLTNNMKLSNDSKSIIADVILTSVG